jgi:Bacterial Ig-like domain/Bacterial Ig domain
MSTDDWKPLNIGAGGYVTGIDIAADGTMVVRTDTYGAYLWNGTQWQQLVTSMSMPAADVGADYNDGVYEIRIAPSNTNIFYMEYFGCVYRSDDKGTTWTKTAAFPHVAGEPNDVYRLTGQKMAVDPNNPNVVYVGTQQNGLFVSVDGGASWQNVSGVPVSAKDGSGLFPGITGIVFDTNSGITGGKTNVIYASSYGHGVYKSTDGGVSWSALSGGPIDVDYAAISPTGAYYAADGTSLWRYENGAWTKLLTEANGIRTVAIDPFDPSHIVVQTPGGSLEESHNGGATWSGLNWGTQLTATDIPWLATTGPGMSIGGTAFDPLVPNKLWTSSGVGVWNTTLPDYFVWNTPIVWNSQSVGIEQLCATDLVVAPGGKPVVAAWDFGVFYVDDLHTYPSTHGVTTAFAAGWSVDYASTQPSYLVAIADWWGREQSGYSTDGGQTWKIFPSFPSFAGQTIGGTIAASSPTNIIWAPANRYAPYYTQDGGVTWNPVTLPGVTDWNSFHWAYYLDKTTVTADRVLPNTFYMYYVGNDDSGVYKTTDGGTTWTKVFSGEISPFSTFNSKIEAVPGQAGHLFFTGGQQGNRGSPNPASFEGFYHSTDGGATWTAVPNVLEVYCFGFGKSASPDGPPAIYIVGWVNNVYGIWQSNDDAQSWTKIGDWPTGSLDAIKTISGDPDIYGQVYVGFAGSGYAYLSADGSASAPIIVSFSVDSGILGDCVTNDDTLTLSGTAAANSTVKVYDGATLLGLVTADGNGAWSYTTATLSDGGHSLTVTGDASTASAALNVTVDTIAPAAPVISAFSTDSGTANDGITNDNTLTLSGIAAVNSTVKVYDDATLLGQVAADSSGTWSYTTAALSNGAHSFHVTATDAAGNTSIASTATNVTVDMVAPEAPIIAHSAVNGRTVSLTGTAEANGTVKIYDKGVLLGSTTANDDASWSYITDNLANGKHVFTATDTDVAGNTSIVSDALSTIINHRSTQPASLPSNEAWAAQLHISSIAGFATDSDSGRHLPDSHFVDAIKWLASAASSNPGSAAVVDTSKDGIVGWNRGGSKDHNAHEASGDRTNVLYHYSEGESASSCNGDNTSANPKTSIVDLDSNHLDTVWLTLHQHGII